MSFKWSKEMLEDIVLTKRMESNTLEFKSGEDLNNVMKSNNNKKNEEFSKDISAMANSNGGDIIYGISEEKKNDKSVAGSFSFVERNFLIDSIEQKLNSLIIPKIDNIEIIPIDFSETEMVVIISIPKSYTAHQAKDKRYYKRFGFLVEPMEDWEVKDVINRGLKPEVELIFSAVKDNNYLSINNITYGCYDINIKVHNKGKVSANYLNCFIEIEKNLNPSKREFISDVMKNYSEKKEKSDFSQQIVNQFKVKIKEQDMSKLNLDMETLKGSLLEKLNSADQLNVAVLDTMPSKSFFVERVKNSE